MYAGALLAASSLKAFCMAVIHCMCRYRSTARHSRLQLLPSMPTWQPQLRMLQHMLRSRRPRQQQQSRQLTK
jgi:hypothetical protein